MSRAASLKFPHTKPDFFVSLNQRVNQYFKSNNISRNANAEMIVKTIFMFMLYFIPYGIIISGAITNVWSLLALCLVMGMGLAGIGLSVMHDANHGAYSKKAWVNNLIGYSLNIIGGHAFNWKIQHNVLHHTYTNVHDADEDISPRGVMRMAPESPWKPAHRFQHIYAWFLYCLLTLVWVFVKDFARLVKYQHEGLVKKQQASITREWIIMVTTKVLYLGYIVVLPAILLPLAWWQVLIGFVAMHAVSGFILSVIFQPAHVVDGTEYPEPDQHGVLENTWAVHQLRTTTNFANRNKILSWYVGGLNFQIEHHLFPNVCHVHYRKLAPIVEQTAREFNLPYKTIPTFMGAMAGHARLLKKLGQQPAMRIAGKH
ncbi:MAG: acyl-CoA desaturase [Cyclobacteriaceae bacterium]|nr:acyl-CoA desaturase [Cyclobacteriaceae bacterium]